MERRIERIARRVIAMSQMVKKCTFHKDGTVTGFIKELIYRKENNDMDMFNEIFMSDVRDELADIDIHGPLKSVITVNVDHNDYVKFKFKFKEKATNWDREQLKTHEWVVKDLM